MLLYKVVCRGRETQWQQLVDRSSMAGQQMKQQLILIIFYSFQSTFFYFWTLIEQLCMIHS